MLFIIVKNHSTTKITLNLIDSPPPVKQGILVGNIPASNIACKRFQSSIKNVLVGNCHLGALIRNYENISTLFTSASITSILKPVHQEAIFIFKSY